MIRNIHRIAGALALAAVFAFAAPQVAEANTAANTILRNTVTVNYQDTDNTPMTAVTADVDVTVTLVAATPTLSAPVDQTTDPATAVVFNYTLTATANGPEVYNLSVVSAVETASISGSNTALSDPSLTLGATTVAAAGNIPATTDFAITVPSDGASDSIVNGIVALDTVVINGQAFSVVSVTDNGGTPGTSTITVNGATAAAIAVGDVIGEQQAFTLTVTPGTMVASPTPPVTITVTVSADDAGAAAATSDATMTTVTFPSLGVAKEVSTDGGATFVASASAAPGATLTYRITVTNNGTSDATSVVITDPAPQFTTYAAGTAKRATGAASTYGAAPASLTDGADGDDYTFGAGTATYNVGTIVPGAGNAVQLFFQVTID